MSRQNVSPMQTFWNRIGELDDADDVQIELAVQAAIGVAEQRLENDQVRRLQRDHRCPACGAES